MLDLPQVCANLACQTPTADFVVHVAAAVLPKAAQTVPAGKPGTELSFTQSLPQRRAARREIETERIGQLDEESRFLLLLSAVFCS